MSLMTEQEKKQQNTLWKRGECTTRNVILCWRRQTWLTVIAISVSIPRRGDALTYSRHQWWLICHCCCCCCRYRQVRCWPCRSRATTTEWSCSERAASARVRWCCASYAAHSETRTCRRSRIPIGRSSAAINRSAAVQVAECLLTRASF